MNSLHRRDDAERAKSRDVLRAEMLRVLDAPADVLLIRIGDEDPLEQIQRLPVRTVANCVHAQLEIVLDGELRGLFDVRDWRRVQAGAVGLSAYGSSIHAPRDPSAPSICFLIARTVR